LLISVIIPPLGQWIKDLYTTYPIDAGQMFYVLSETPGYINQVVTQNQSINWLPIIIKTIYWGGVILVGIRFFRGLLKIYRLYQSGDKTPGKRFTLVTNQHYHLPFSFFHYVFISRQLPLKESYQKIIQHELTHVRQWHSLDIILTECLHIFFWFNPILHFYRKALQQAHEYYADACVLKTHSNKDYGQLLLDPTMSGLEIALVNQFFNSHLKNRIMMMYQEKSTRSALAKYLVSLPILVLALFIFSNSAIDSTTDPIPFKKEVKDAIVVAESIEDLSERVRGIMKQYQDVDDMPSDTINKYLNAIGKETGLVMELIFSERLKFSPNRERARVTGYLEHLDRIYKVPPIYTKLENLLKTIGGRWPLFMINGNLMYGDWYRIDPDKIISYSYISPEEAMRLHGDMAHGGIIDFLLTDFSKSEMDKVGVVIESAKGFKLEKDAVKNIDTPARFPGCEDISGQEAQLCAVERFNEYIADLMQYPEEAKKQGIEGTVMVRFLVTDKGAISNPTIINDIGGGCAQEAKYLVQSMNTISKQWTPAMKDGKAVTSLVTLPIIFSLHGEVTRKIFSGRHESNLAGDIKKPMPEVMENPELTKEMIALLSDFEINPRPIFVVDGQIMEKDSIRLKQDQIVKATLLDEEVAALKYETVNQRALEIYTGPNIQTSSEDMKPSEPSRKSHLISPAPKQDKISLITDLNLYPNPTKFDLNLSFKAPKGPLEIRIHDAGGQLLYKESIPDFNGSYDNIISNSQFVNGEAVISFIQDDQIQTKKIIFAK
jgi:TonB family protein